jgi:serine/threonine protein kinase
MIATAGMKLGPYEIVSLVGAGGMGEVYRAKDTKLNRNVALKILPDLFNADPDWLARFQREAHVLASLNHPNSEPDGKRPSSDDPLAEEGGDRRCVIAAVASSSGTSGAAPGGIGRARESPRGTPRNAWGAIVAEFPAGSCTKNPHVSRQVALKIPPDPFASDRERMVSADQRGAESCGQASSCCSSSSL